MNLVIGILMFGLGLIALFAWFPDLLPFFKGALVCSLLLWGSAGIAVGLAKQRAKKHLKKAKSDAPSEAEQSSQS